MKKPGKPNAETRHQRTIIIRGIRNEENIKWLQRSVIGEGVRPLDPTKVLGCLEKIGLKVEKVRAIDSYKVIITFGSGEELTQSMQAKKEEMLSFLDKVRCWSEEETCRVRRIWLECKGIPMHGWSRS